MISALIASHGYLAVFVGTLLGSCKGNALIERVPALARHKARIHELLDRYDGIIILTMRFLYSLRIAGPLIIGLSQLQP